MRPRPSGGLLYTREFRSWLEEDLTDRVSRALGRTCELRVELLRPHALQIKLSKLRIAAEPPTGEPLLSIEELDARGSWWALMRGRLGLAELRVGGL